MESVDADRVAHELLGHFALASLKGDQPEQVDGAGVPRLTLQDLAIHPLGLTRSVRRDGARALRLECFGERWP